ncbi:MAG: hypothetical protein PHR19_02500 [Bacteroidales bacterium]|nr:hypothetical protein [Bacteroidales bacterium]
MKEWIKCSDRLPKECLIVETKIDDNDGLRNEQDLKIIGSLWWLADNSVYVYYKPTHWREKMKYLNQENNDAYKDNLNDKHLERVAEIEKSIIDDTINYDGDKGLESFLAFVTSEEMTGDEAKTLNDVIVAALQAPFADRYKPVNAIVCRAVEWQAERLAKLEDE